MTWNWQKPDWPGFSWDQTLLRKAEEHFLMGSGVFVGTIKHLDAIDQEQLTIEAMQVVSGAPYAPKVHFKAPPSSRVPEEMTQFLVWFKPYSSRRYRPFTRFDEGRDCTFVLRVHSSFRG